MGTASTSGASELSARDTMGNKWVWSATSSSIHIDPSNFGLKSAAASRLSIPCPGTAEAAGSVVALACDAGGFMWLVCRAALFRCDPCAADPFAARTTPSAVNASWLQFDWGSAGQPSPGTFTAARQLPMSGYMAVTMGDAELAVDIDGDGACTAVPAGQAEEAVPASGWLPAPPLPFGNHDIHACQLDGQMYISGGLAPAGFPAEYRVFDELYSFDGEQWRLASKMPARRTFHGLAALEGELWLCGGADGKEGHSGAPDDR